MVDPESALQRGLRHPAPEFGGRCLGRDGGPGEAGAVRVRAGERGPRVAADGLAAGAEHARRHACRREALGEVSVHVHGQDGDGRGRQSARARLQLGPAGAAGGAGARGRGGRGRYASEHGVRGRGRGDAVALGDRRSRGVGRQGGFVAARRGAAASGSGGCRGRWGRGRRCGGHWCGRARGRGGGPGRGRGGGGGGACCGRRVGFGSSGERRWAGGRRRGGRGGGGGCLGGRTGP